MQLLVVFWVGCVVHSHSIAAESCDGSPHALFSCFCGSSVNVFRGDDDDDDDSVNTVYVRVCGRTQTRSMAKQRAYASTPIQQWMKDILVNGKGPLARGSSQTMAMIVMILSLCLLTNCALRDPSLAVSQERTTEIQIPAAVAQALRSSSSAGAILERPWIHHATTAKPCPKIKLSDPAIVPLLQSQDAEDKTLLNWFNGLCGGTYIEMGGLDGITYSNSYVFNKSPLNWTGVLVEGMFVTLRRYCFGWRECVWACLDRASFAYFHNIFSLLSLLFGLVVLSFFV
jgi:hypothetical protein